VSRLISGAGVAVVVVVLFVVANGGYVYKTTCPNPDGSSTTSWTYGIDDILPYIRSTSPPCVSHTATRLLLSVTGVWKLHSGGGGTSASSASSATDASGAAALGAVTKRISQEFATERRETAAVLAKGKSGQLSRTAELAAIVAGLRAASARFVGIRSSLRSSVVTVKSGDQDISSADALLVTWLGYQIASDNAFAASPTQATISAVQKRIGAQLTEVVTKLRAVSVAIQAKYPGVSDWTFLSSS